MSDSSNTAGRDTELTGHHGSRVPRAAGWTLVGLGLLILLAMGFSLYSNGLLQEIKLVGGLGLALLVGLFGVALLLAVVYLGPVWYQNSSRPEIILAPPACLVYLLFSQLTGWLLFRLGRAEHWPFLLGLLKANAIAVAVIIAAGVLYNIFSSIITPPYGP